MSKQFENMQKLAFGKVVTEESTLLTESTLKDKIKELVHSSLGEAKKKKKEESTDVAPQEDTDMSDDTLGATDSDAGADMSTTVDTGIDIDPKVKNIQDLLQKAYANAKALGDEKLMTQIGNTITMVVRNQVLGGQSVNETELPGIIQRDFPNEQNKVVKSYLTDLKNYEKTHTDDLDDFKNLATAVGLYYKELLDKIKYTHGSSEELSTPPNDGGYF